MGTSHADICRSASEMIESLGRDAENQATLKADECLELNDISGSLKWARIAAMVAELSDDTPTSRQTHH